MGAKRVINGVHVIPMGMANAFLIEGDDGLTLIDAGFPGKEAAVFQLIRELGRSSNQLKHIIFTHGHPDHIGSAAAIVRETSAKTHMHPLDIPMAEVGVSFDLCDRHLVYWGKCCAGCSSIPISERSRLPSISI